MQYIGYLFFRLTVFVFSLIPFRAMYFLSDGIAFLMHKVFGYRRKVILENLKNSFPEKSVSEVEEIIKGIYINLSDILLESIKGFSMSEATMRKRYIFTNPDLVQNSNIANGSSIGIASHCANWEWGTIAYPLFVNRCIIGYYKPLKNEYIDSFARKTRGINGLELVPIGKTAWGFDHFKDIPSMHVLLSDQNPATHLTHWTTFLNQDTACLLGGDKYAHLYNLPVYYVETLRVGRGFYNIQFEILTLTPNELPAEAITKMYMARLEKQIRAKPQDWLWSHKRWKIKRPVA